MSALEWEATRTPSAADSEVVSDGVLSFGRALAHDGQAQPIACFAKLAGAVVAGAVGRTEYGRPFVTGLWVSEGMRNRGLGTETLLRLEAEAARVGCGTALLETLNDRTARLYERLGYQKLAEVKRYVGPFNRHIMLKPLSSAGDAREA